MSGSVNKAIIIGRLTRDPEIRKTGGGDPVANMSVATSEKWRDKSTGEQKEKSEFHRVTAWGKLAEIAERYLKKGSQVYLEGQIQTRKWTDQSGQEKYSTEIVLRGFNGTLAMLDAPQSGGGGYQEPEPQAGRGQQDDDMDEEIPFITSRSIL